MDEVAQGAVWSDLSHPIRDAAGTPLTAGAGSIVVTLFDAANVSQASGVTATHVSGGRYRLSKTLAADAAVGAWGGLLTYNDGANPVRTQSIDFEVITAARADPAAAIQPGITDLDDDIAAVASAQTAMQADVDAIATGVDAANATLATLDLGPITATLADLTEAVANLQATLDNDPDIAALIAAVGDVEVALAAVDADVDALQTTLDGLEDDLAAVVALEDEIEALSVAIAALPQVEPAAVADAVVARSVEGMTGATVGGKLARIAAPPAANFVARGLATTTGKIDIFTQPPRVSVSTASSDNWGFDFSDALAEGETITGVATALTRTKPLPHEDVLDFVTTTDFDAMSVLVGWTGQVLTEDQEYRLEIMATTSMPGTVVNRLLMIECIA
jgi:hypothetical protein